VDRHHQQHLDERLQRQLITPTAATASRLQQQLRHLNNTYNTNRGAEDEDDAAGHQVWEPLQPYNTSALFLGPSCKVGSSAAAVTVVGNKARRIWTEDAHLRLAAMGLCYLDVYRKKVWVYATTHPSAMSSDNVRLTLERGFDGWTDKEDATLDVGVLTVLAQGRKIFPFRFFLSFNNNLAKYSSLRCACGQARRKRATRKRRRNCS
jgi:hypothetical protein